MSKLPKKLDSLPEVTSGERSVEARSNLRDFAPQLMLFENAGDLVRAIERAPAVITKHPIEIDGKMMTTHEIKRKLIQLAPKMMAARKKLAKNDGGLGSLKATRRFVDAAEENALNRAQEKLDERRDEISKMLVDMSEGIGGKIHAEKVRKIHEARNDMVGVFEYIKGFEEKITERIEVIRKSYASHNKELEKLAVKNKSLSKAVEVAKEHMEQELKELTEIARDLPLYCKLNAALYYAFMESRSL